MPMKWKRISLKPIWMNINSMILVRENRRLWQYYRKTNEHKDYEAYQSVQAKIRSAIRKVKLKFEQGLVQEAKKSPRKFLAYMKQKTLNRQSVGPLWNNEGKVVNDDEEQTNILNEFFSSVFTNKDMNKIPKPEQLYKGRDPLDRLYFLCSWWERRLEG